MFQARYRGNQTAFQAGKKFPPEEWVDVEDDDLFLTFVKMGNFDVKRPDGDAHYVQKTHEPGDVYEDRIAQLEFENRNLQNKLTELEAVAAQSDSNAEERARRAEADADALRAKLKSARNEIEALRMQLAGDAVQDSKQGPEDIELSSVPEKSQKQILTEEAESLGIRVDGRWSVARIQHEIDRALES